MSYVCLQVSTPNFCASNFKRTRCKLSHFCLPEPNPMFLWISYHFHTEISVFVLNLVLNLTWYHPAEMPKWGPQKYHQSSTLIARSNKYLATFGSVSMPLRIQSLVKLHIGELMRYKRRERWVGTAPRHCNKEKWKISQVIKTSWTVSCEQFAFLYSFALFFSNFQLVVASFSKLCLTLQTTSSSFN